MSAGVRHYVQYMYSYPHKTAYRPVARELVAAHLEGIQGSVAGLYLHLPFCRAKCGYCNLFSVANPGKDLLDRYLSAVQRQIAQITAATPLRAVQFDSLVLGGGTPTLLGPARLEQLLTMVEAATGVQPRGAHAVIELSPSCTDRQMVDFLQGRGFARVSLGVQSFAPNELRALGRAEPPGQARRALELLRGRFARCNIDLIYGIPGQTRQSLLRSLQTALSYRPDELFLYPLYVRAGTPLAGTALDEAHTAALYRTGRQALLTAGYRQLSMRRFVLSTELEVSGDCGQESCLSFGCGGRSYLGCLHICEPFAVQPARCRDSLERFLAKTDFLDGLHGYLLNDDEQRRRYVIKNLLHVRGVRAGEYHTRFARDLAADFPLLDELVQQGLAHSECGRFRLSEEGLARSDAIGPLLISRQVMERCDAFYNAENRKAEQHGVDEVRHLLDRPGDFRGL